MTAGDNRLLLSGTGKWWICILLLLATVLNYLDRQVLSLTAERLMAEFHIDKEGFGHVVAAFRYPYAFVQIFGGWIVDSFGARRVFPGAVGIWSAAGMLTAFAPGLGGLSMCRFFLGVGEAFNWPCALKATNQLLAPADRPLANGIFNSGTAVGAMLAPVVVTILAARWGWRSPFLFTGALGAVWVMLWLWLTRSRRDDLRGKTMAAAEVASVLGRIARNRRFWLLATSAVVVNGVSYFLADWIPLYLKTERGFSFAAGNLLSILVYAGLDAGNLLTGWFIRARVNSGVPVVRARRSALVLSCLLMSCAVLAGVVPSRYVALLCIVLTAIGVAGFLVIYLTLVQEVDPLHVGAAAGMLGGLGNLAYGMLSPSIGRLSDLHMTGLTFTLIGLLPWLAFLSISRVERDQKEPS
jgi:MFS transporter, ACS family, hexuronate transporter